MDGNLTTPEYEMIEPHLHDPARSPQESRWPHPRQVGCAFDRDFSRSTGAALDQSRNRDVRWRSAHGARANGDTPDGNEERARRPGQLRRSFRAAGRRRPKCGMIGADLRPNWNDRLLGESLTGRQWRRVTTIYCCWFLGLFRRGQIATLRKIHVYRWN